MESYRIRQNAKSKSLPVSLIPARAAPLRFLADMEIRSKSARVGVCGSNSADRKWTADDRTNEKKRPHY